MKILFFTNEYSHEKLPPTGGAGSSIKILGQELSHQGHEVHVYGFSKKKHVFKDGKIKISFFKKYSKSFPFSEAIRSLSSRFGIKAAELFFIEKERKYLAKKLKQYVLKNKIDIIESFVFNGYTAFWDNRVPLVVRFHGSRGFWHYYLNKEKEEFKILMEQKALESTPFTVAISKFSARAVKSIYNIEVDRVIYNGIDHELFSPRKNVQEIPQSIFYFGTLSSAKGVDRLCRIFNEVIERYPEASLHIIGKGKNYWEQTCKKVLSEKALTASLYYGPKNSADLPEIIQQATLFVFTSQNENFGLVFAEAMALEKPIIAPNIEAAQEIVDHNENGFLATTTEDYLKFISLLFEDHELRIRISKEARIKIEENFTKEVMMNKSVAYYEDILSMSNK